MTVSGDDELQQVLAMSLQQPAAQPALTKQRTVEDDDLDQAIADSIACAQRAASLLPENLARVSEADQLQSAIAASIAEQKTGKQTESDEDDGVKTAKLLSLGQDVSAGTLATASSWVPTCKDVEFTQEFLLDKENEADRKLRAVRLQQANGASGNGALARRRPDAKHEEQDCMSALRKEAARLGAE